MVLKLSTRKHKRDFHITVLPWLAYAYGYAEGDGSLRRDYIRFSAYDVERGLEDLLRKICDAVSSQYSIRFSTYRDRVRGRTEFFIRSVALRRAIRPDYKVRDHGRIRRLLEEHEIGAAFLGGLIDSDGQLSKPGPERPGGQVRLWSTDNTLLHIIADHLLRIGIDCRVSRPIRQSGRVIDFEGRLYTRKRDLFYLHIFSRRGANIRRLYDFCGSWILIPRKKKIVRMVLQKRK